MRTDSGEALRRLIVDFEKRAAQADNDEWGREREAVYIECADAIRTLLAEGDAQEPPQPQHALTIYFGRFLTEQEWRAVVDAVRAYVPFEHLLEANAITSSEARDSRPAPPLQQSCCEPTPDRTGRSCDKPQGHDGDHWTYGMDGLTWPSRHAPSLDWQPIETAPKDGTSVLVGRWFTKTANGYPPKWLSDLGEYEQSADSSEYGPGWDWRWWSNWDDGQPTHWMPLPAPPVTPTQE